MNNSQVLNLKNYNAVAWGLLSILWGITVLFDFVPLGIGLVGTGLILLGANIFLLLNGLPTKSDNTLFGLLALAWGGLELARPLLRILFQSADLDWVIFAILLMGLGLILLIRGLVRSWRIDLQKE